MPRKGKSRAAPSQGWPAKKAHIEKIGMLFGPPSLRAGATDTQVVSQRQKVESEIARIVKEFKLEGTEDQLEKSINAAASSYCSWWIFNAHLTTGIGTKEDFRALERALGRASQLLKKRGVINRLEIAVKATPGEAFTTEISDAAWDPHTILGEAVFDPIGRARSAIRDLSKVTKTACSLDGRVDPSKRRDDIRAAAKPVREYWTKIARRSGKLTNWGGFSHSVRFIHSCLVLIDPTVSEQLVLDLDR